MKKTERVRLFFRRLEQARPCENHDEAYALIVMTLNSVEDAHSGVPFNPATWQNDGRLYPPQPDRGVLSKDCPGVIRYRSLGHWTYVAPNGAFRIEEIATHKTLVDRPGWDGRTVEAFRTTR